MTLAVPPSGGAWGRARSAVSNVAQRVLPDTTVRFHHIEPDLRLNVHLRRDLPVWSAGLARFEAHCVRVLRAALGEGDVAVDVGAKIGFFATLFSRWVGEAGSVLAIEPDPGHRELLRRNLDDNFCDNVLVYGGPVGRRRPDHEALLPAAIPGGGRTSLAPLAPMPVLESSAEPETIDRLVDDEDAFPALIRLDLASGNDAALTGARYTLQDCRPVVVATLTGPDGHGVLETLRWAGYQVYDIATGRPHESGGRAQAIAGLAAEARHTARGLSVMAALDGGAG